MPNGKLLYGLVVGIESQKKIIEEFCYGKCGKIVVGALDSSYGPLMVCRVPASECPRFEKEMDAFGATTIDNELIWIRKLK